MNWITCAKCSHWSNGRRVEVKHMTIEDVRRCARGEHVAVASHPSPAAVAVDVAPDKPVSTRERNLALASKLPDLRNMRYAIQVIDFEKSPEPVWKFYQIDKPTKGKWVGWAFVKIQAGDDYYPLRGESALTILEVVSNDPAKAASDYGHQIGRCGICHRTLTVPESIERGIGPICAGKAGW